MTTRLRVDILLDERQIDDLITLAIKLGYRRDAPTLRWSRDERKDAARYALQKLAGGSR